MELFFLSPLPWEFWALMTYNQSLRSLTKENKKEETATGIKKKVEARMMQRKIDKKQQKNQKERGKNAYNSNRTSDKKNISYKSF